jgi:glutamate-5-semialdehyde dehydrogenase
MNSELKAAVSLPELMRAMGAAARAAELILRAASTAQKNRALRSAAQGIRTQSGKILAANEQDMSEARGKMLSAALLERLRLDEKRIGAMAAGLEDIASLADPIGTVLAQWQRPNGLDIQRIRVPLGVIGIIYESRPNVTADAGALCLKSGNAVILRAGSESARSSAAIHACLEQGLQEAGLPRSCIQLVPTADRAAVGFMLADMTDSIDVIVPRGGKSLIERVQNEARVPVIGHLEGVCHVYVDKEADLQMATRIVINAKMRRTGICGAAETLLVDKSAPAGMLESLVEALIEAGCVVRGDAITQRVDARVVAATEADWYAEYLDAIIAVRVVDGLEGAVTHIAKYGSQHTDAIVTADTSAAEQFLARVDSAIVLHNASTQFADGGEFGMGAEIGISTDKFHARGPVGVEELTSYKYLVRGTGQVRPG